MSNKKIKIDKKQSAIRDEMNELLLNSKTKKGTQLFVDEDSQAGLKELDEIKMLLGKTADNPAEKYNIYYNGINKLLRKYLPKGKEYKRARDIIYDEKNIFLNAGCKKSDNKGIRKSDGRMTYQQNMSDILDIVAEWVSTSQVAIDLYDMFYNLNEKYGYGHEVYDESSTKYNKAKVNEKGAE